MDRYQVLSKEVQWMQGHRLINRDEYINTKHEYTQILSKEMRQYIIFNPYPTAFPYGNGMVLHVYQQQESSTTKTVHKVINKGLKAYV